MRKFNGFTLIEVLVAMSIIITIIATIIPINVFIKKERKVLSDRRVIAATLHDEIQHIIWDDEVFDPYFHFKVINYLDVQFHFSTENELIKGCATWENVNKRKEKICFYGVMEE